MWFSRPGGTGYPTIKNKIYTDEINFGIAEKLLLLTDLNYQKREYSARTIKQRNNYAGNGI